MGEKEKIKPNERSITTNWFKTFKLHLEYNLKPKRPNIERPPKYIGKKNVVMV